MKWTTSTTHKYKLIPLAIATVATLSTSPMALAHCKKNHCHHQATVATAPATETTYKNYKDEMTQMIVTAVPLFVPHWYVGAHMGVSRTHDKAAPGSGNSVTQIGPGWTVNLGYQFVQFYRATLAAELGYTQYHNSNETTVGTNVASTEHFSTYLAAVVQYPIVNKFSVVGKLGLAYSYAKKVFTAGGASASANDYSPYYGAGIAYQVTPNAAFLLQWARARGDSKTGSTDLTSLGVTYNLI